MVKQFTASSRDKGIDASKKLIKLKLLRISWKGSAEKATKLVLKENNKF
jgi:hypothetical protein